MNGGRTNAAGGTKKKIHAHCLLFGVVKRVCGCGRRIKDIDAHHQRMQRSMKRGNQEQIRQGESRETRGETGKKGEGLIMGERGGGESGK